VYFYTFVLIMAEEFEHPHFRENRAPNKLLRAKHEFTAVEKRIFYLVLDDLNPNLEISSDLFSGNKVVRIYNARAALGNTSFKNLMQAVDSIQTRRIVFVDQKNKEFDRIVPFPRVRYSAGTLEITILQDVLPELTDLKKTGYTRYELNAALSLSSQHSQRLYEILSGWKVKGQSYVEWSVPLDRLKIWLNVDKIKTYDKYAQFTRGVLDVGKKELMRKTEIQFDYEIKEKEGRKISNLLFKVKYSDRQGSDKAEDQISRDINDTRIHACLVYLDEIGIKREDLRKEIVNRIDEFYSWKYALQTEKFKVSKSISGHLLTTLGLV